MKNSVDVVIVTAADGEDDAVRLVEIGARGPWQDNDGPEGYGFAVASREYLTPSGEVLRIVLTRSPDMGVEAAIHAASQLIDAYGPRCLAMSGVCAGRPGRTNLGDVIIADRVYRYDVGEVVSSKSGGTPVFHADMLTYALTPQWKQRAQQFGQRFGQDPVPQWLRERPRTRELQAMWLLNELLADRDPVGAAEREQLCRDWTPVVRQLRSRQLVSQKGRNLVLTASGRRYIEQVLIDNGGAIASQDEWQTHIGPLGTGSNLIRDMGIWERLQDNQRRVIGLDMEASAIGMVGQLHGVSHTIVVKGVMDFAEPDRNDGFRSFAARAAAEVLIGFVRENLVRGHNHALEIGRPSGPPLSDSSISVEETGRDDPERYEANGLDDKGNEDRTRAPASIENVIGSGDNQKRNNSSLPQPSYRELVGRDATIDDLVAAILDDTGRWLSGIDGMGGIGKTVLAREVVERARRERVFDAIIWESAARTGGHGLTFAGVLDVIGRTLGALDIASLAVDDKVGRVRELLAMTRVLVVLDNLETAAEPQSDLVTGIAKLANPFKALLTSRHRFQGDIYAVHLTGLDDDESVRLIRQEAEDKRIQKVANAPVAELRQVARVTGGSPLALKLVTDQLQFLPLNTVLEELRNISADNGHTEDDDYQHFYRSIFFPSWGLLRPAAQELLIAMAHFAPGVGGTLEAIAATSGLGGDVLRRSIDELWRLSFLEVGSSRSLKAMRYYLHPLTRYFVLSDIVREPPGPTESPDRSLASS